MITEEDPRYILTNLAKERTPVAKVQSAIDNAARRFVGLKRAWNIKGVIKIARDSNDAD